MSYKYTSDVLVRHVKNSLSNADNNISKISSDIMSLDGMSGTKTRAFYNNIASIPGVSYLEVGSWKGSSACSALFGNSMDMVAIDNWSQFNGPRDEFEKNVNRFTGYNKVKTINQDSFEVDVSSLPTFTIYMYDGDHSIEAHEKALTHYIDAMEDEFIFIVDDWMFEGIRKGTYAAIDKLGLTVKFYDYRRNVVVREDNAGWWADGKNGLELVHSERGEYWNGIGVFVLSKHETI
jgi:hypothetical protein